MTEWNTEELIEADKRFIWHPFTNMREWCAPEHEPLVLIEGRGALLRDSRGREYIDGNSSIWTNVHGHNHAHKRRDSPAVETRGAHFLSWLYKSGCDRARARNCRSFSREFIEQGILLRRWLD